MEFIFPQKGVESIGSISKPNGYALEFDSIDHAVLFKQKFNNNPVMAYIEKIEQDKNFVNIYTTLRMDVDFNQQTVKIHTK